MRVVVQRVLTASVQVDGREVGRIDGPGLLVLVGITHGDDERTAQRLAAKVHGLRVFDAGRLDRTDICVPPGSPREVSAEELGLPLLVVSQFTLYADVSKGRRPTWEAAARGDVAAPLVAAFVEELRRRGATVATGEFGADMQVSLVNDGPVTLVIDS